MTVAEGRGVSVGVPSLEWMYSGKEVFVLSCMRDHLGGKGLGGGGSCGGGTRD